MAKEVKYIGPVFFQGDVAYIQVEALPEGLTPAAPEEGRYILGHSETGHHHVIEATPNVKVLRDPSDAVTAYLQVIQDDVKLEHLRSTDTHEAHTIGAGLYQVLNGVEYRPEGWARMSD